MSAELPAATSLVVELRCEGLWCYLCGSHSSVVYEVRLVCPYCTAEAPVRLRCESAALVGTDAVALEGCEEAV